MLGWGVYEIDTSEGIGLPRGYTIYKYYQLILFMPEKTYLLQGHHLRQQHKIQSAYDAIPSIHLSQNIYKPFTLYRVIINFTHQTLHYYIKISCIIDTRVKRETTVAIPYQKFTFVSTNFSNRLILGRTFLGQKRRTTNRKQEKRKKCSG